MFTVKLENENDKRNRQEVWMCSWYSKLLNDEEHILTLHGVPNEPEPVYINLRHLPEDDGGKYNQAVYIMNEQGQTIDKIGYT